MSESMNLSKEEFVKIINRLKEARDLKRNIDKLMEKARDNIENDFMNGASLMINHQDTVIMLLSRIMNDKTDEDGMTTIEWWIYETNYGESEFSKIYTVGEEIPLKTSEQLYDYLTSKE